MAFKIDRQLVEVKFVSWVPGEVRLMSEKSGRGFIPPDAVTQFGCKLWCPWPVDDHNDQYLPHKMKPEEHGVEWAYREVKRLRPEGMEVIAVIGHNLTGILESSILNQPKQIVGEEGSTSEPTPPTTLKGLVEVTD